MHLSLKSRLFGFAASLILTLAAFAMIVRPDFFHLELKSTICIIFVFALFQSLIQSICFLNLWNEKRPRWNLVVFASTIFIIIIIIAGSIWIMNHLNYNMMHIPCDSSDH